MHLSHRRKAIPSFFKEGLYRSVRVPPSLNAEQRSGNRNAVLGSVIDLNQQHLLVCNKLRQPIVGSLQLVDSGCYSQVQLRGEGMKALVRVASPGDIEEGEKMIDDATLSVVQRAGE
jgi:hypothetical protein